MGGNSEESILMYDDDHQSVVDNTRRIHSHPHIYNIYHRFYTHKTYRTVNSHVKCNIELDWPVSMFNNIVLLYILLAVCFGDVYVPLQSIEILVYLGPEFIDCRWLCVVNIYTIPYANTQTWATQRY